MDRAGWQEIPSSKGWIIMPYETRKIADIIVLAAEPRIVDGYIKIRTNTTTMDSVLRVSVDVNASMPNMLVFSSRSVVPCFFLFIEELWSFSDFML